MRRQPLRVAFLTTLCLFPLGRIAAADTEDGRATGTLTVEGRTTPLTYAYARAEKGFFDPTKQAVRVILSDVPISEAALSDPFALHQMAAEGKLHAVEVVLDSERQPVSGGILHEAFAQMQGYVSVTGMHEFQAMTFDTNLVEGKLSMARPDEFVNKKFVYSATFRASVWYRPAPSATGPAAAQTAPGKAVIAFLEATRSGDRGAIRKLMTAEAGKQLDGPHGSEMLRFLKMATPDPATAEIDSVGIQADKAEVAVVEKSKDAKVTSSFKLAKEDGQWKVSGM